LVIGPVRLYLAARGGRVGRENLGLVAAIAATTVFFAGTPFIVDDVGELFGVSVGTAGLMSTVQVGAFAATTFVAGRRFRTDRRFLIWGSLAAALANAFSVIAPSFGVLLGLRAVAGVGAGLLVWLSWAKAMRTAAGIRAVAAVGPVTALVASPVISWFAEVGGAPAVFWLLAAAFLPAAVLPATFTGYRFDRSRISPSRSNVVLIAALGVMTFAANGLWVYVAVIGETIGLSPALVALGFSGNALTGFIAARMKSRPFPPRVWLFVMAGATVLVTVGASPALWALGVLVWGFSFWMAVPMMLSSIASWSLAPEERVGDAQSAMAVGRALGPAVGGLFLGDAMSFAAIGVFAVVGVSISAMMAYGVATYRRDRVPPQERPVDV
jgi:predicted MFS family arabinose efflux permease